MAERYDIGLVPGDSQWGEYYEEKKKAGNPFYGKACFYTFAEVRKMVELAGLEISGVRSTLFQKPEGPRRVGEAVDGYSEEAGFLCIDARKKR